MSPIEKKVDLPTGPYGDIRTRNIVLQVMGDTRSLNNHELSGSRTNFIEKSLERLINPGEVLQDSGERAKKLMELLEKKGQAFRHTPEYYAAIEDEKTRIKAYRDLTVISTVPYGEDAEIAENPCKFLYLPEDATLGQIRDAYIRLSKKWFPDLIYPENDEQRERIFGKQPPLEGKDFKVWLKEWLDLQPLDVKKLEKLSPDEQEDYRKKRQAYREKEIEYEKVKVEMRRRATVKMQILNKAHAAAKRRFSKQEIESFAGFEWRQETLHGLGWRNFDYDKLNLEGDGQLRKDTGKWALDNRAYLAFDYGDAFFVANRYDYRQFLYLRSFFAWTELRQGKGLCPTLLDDITKAYKLGDDQAEQLRIMILNHEEPEFITAALNIIEYNELLNFLDDVYDGPTYSHYLIGVEDEIYYPLGVEFTPDERMILKYNAQKIQGIDRHFDKQEAQFSRLDFQIMRAIAYGPLLQEPKLW